MKFIEGFVIAVVSLFIVPVAGLWAAIINFIPTVYHGGAKWEILCRDPDSEI